MGTYLDQTELYLFNEGKSAYAYRALGCHRVTMEDGGAAYRFAVWAPNALSVTVLHHGRLAGAYKKRLRGGFIQIRNIYGE